jgi:hypothetical protein
MVRVGGGWDTLENYLNKHDPCRRTGGKSLITNISSINLFLSKGHRRTELHDHHKDIPILAIPNNTISSTFQKTTPYGKSVTIKTEDFPLTKPTIHDTNLADAQLVITRDAAGRHHIGQITYKSEEDLTQPRSCPHHHPHPSSPVPKIKSVRGTGRVFSPSIYQKQSSPSIDQDYSSYTPSSSIETNEHRPYKPESTIRDRSKSNVSNDNFKTTNLMKRSKSAFSEGMIDNIDGYITPTFAESENDFDISDIGDALRINHNGDDPTNMDEDSLESSEDILENKKKPAPPPIVSNKQPIITKVKSGGVCTALYLAQKQRQATISKNSSPTLSYSRSNTLPDVVEAVKKEEQIQKSRRKSSGNSRRSKSTEFFDKSPLNDMSKLDRDSGFDEQDFHCERLQSSYDDNSSVSSLKSSINRSLSSDLNGQTYRENKAYELRLKALDSARILNEQSTQDSRLNGRKNFNYPSTRTNELYSPTNHKYRKNIPKNFYLKQQ